MPGPRPVSHQQHHLCGHQWSGGSEPRTGGLDGHPAGHGLRGGQRPQHGPGGPHPGPPGTTRFIPTGVARGAGLLRSGGLCRLDTPVLVAGADHLGGGLLQRQRAAVSICRCRVVRAKFQRKSRVAGDGWRSDRRGHRPQPGDTLAHHDGRAVCRCLRCVGGGRPGVAGDHFAHPVSGHAGATDASG